MTCPLQQHQEQWTLPSSQYKKLRLRNCVELSNRVGKAWCNHLTLANDGNGPASTRLKDDVELCIELLAEEEELTENSLLITVQQWHPDLQKLEEDSQELVMFATDTLGDLKLKLSHMGSVAVGNIAAALAAGGQGVVLVPERVPKLRHAGVESCAARG